MKLGFEQGRRRVHLNAGFAGNLNLLGAVNFYFAAINILLPATIFDIDHHTAIDRFVATITSNYRSLTKIVIFSNTLRDVMRLIALDRCFAFLLHINLITVINIELTPFEDRGLLAVIKGLRLFLIDGCRARLMVMERGIACYIIFLITFDICRA